MLCNTKIGFPVFDSVESSFDSNEFILCGGGGSAKSGVFNRVMTCTLGPRPDNVPGVSVIPTCTFDTGPQIATSCCTVSPTLIAFALESDVVLAEKHEDRYVERKRVNVGESIEVVRSFNSQVFVGTELGSLIVFDLDFQQQIMKSKLHFKAVADVCFSPAYCATCSADGTVRVWDMKTLSCEAILPAYEGMTFREARFLSGNRLVALQTPKTRKGDCFVSVWVRRASKNGGEFVLEAMCKVSPSLATGMAVNAQYLAIGTADNITVFDVDSMQHVLRTFPKVHGLPVTGLFFRNGFLVSTSADATAAMISMEQAIVANRGSQLGATIRFCVVFIFLLLVTAMAVFAVVLVGKDAKWESKQLAFDASVPMDWSRVDLENCKALVLDMVASGLK